MDRTLGGEVCPAFLFEDPPVELVVPEDVERLPWASSSAQASRTSGRLSWCRRRNHLLDEPAPRADVNQLAGLGRRSGIGTAKVLM